MFYILMWLFQLFSATSYSVALIQAHSHTMQFHMKDLPHELKKLLKGDILGGSFSDKSITALQEERLSKMNKNGQD